MSVPRTTHGFGLLMQLQYAVLGLATCLVAARESDSVIYYAVQVSRPWGHVVLGLLFGASLLSLVDALLYQVLHVRWPSVKIVRRMRHGSGLCIAFCWIALLSQAESRFDTHGLLSVYAILAAFLCVSLIKDAHNEHCAIRRRGDAGG